MSDASIFKEAITELNAARERTGIDKNGKKYSMVKDRVEVFRKTFGDKYGIDTSVDYQSGFNNGSVIVAVSKITTREGTVMASGHAMIFVGYDEVASTSPIEAVETSAIGRALACFGLHGGEYASGNEMENVEFKRQVVNHRPNGPVDQAPEYSPEDINYAGEQPPADYQQPDEQTPPPPPPPPKVSTVKLGYMPALDGDLAEECNKVADAVVHLQSKEGLASYWASLKDFRAALRSDEDLFASLKAAFSVASKLIEQRNKNVQ